MQRRDHYARARTKALIETFALLAAMLAGVLAYPLASHGAPMPGTAAPDFALKEIGGSNLRLSEYRGDVVVIAFWASWCGPCRATLAELNRIPARAGAAVPVVLGVNIDGDAARASAITKSMGLAYPTLVDARQAVGRLYEVERLPLTLLLDRDGVVRGRWSEQDFSGEALVRRIEELEP